eukprot:Sspe_Gene.6614::Locus_2235_Transcript_6_8_Confidence_0.176_Length_3207::g.6614::m.6614
MEADLITSVGRQALNSALTTRFALQPRTARNHLGIARAWNRPPRPIAPAHIPTAFPPTETTPLLPHVPPLHHAPNTRTHAYDYTLAPYTLLSLGHTSPIIASFTRWRRAITATADGPQLAATIRATPTRAVTIPLTLPAPTRRLEPILLPILERHFPPGTTIRIQQRPPPPTTVLTAPARKHQRTAPPYQNPPFPCECHTHAARTKYLLPTVNEHHVVAPLAPDLSRVPPGTRQPYNPSHNKLLISALPIPPDAQGKLRSEL